jgi:hypothetical protein
MRRFEHALALLGLAFLAFIGWTWVDIRSAEKRRAAWLS